MQLASWQEIVLTIFGHLHQAYQELFEIFQAEITQINQKLTFNELKFLIQNGNVVEMKMEQCEIKDDNDEFIDLEKITAYLPKIESLKHVILYSFFTVS